MNELVKKAKLFAIKAHFDVNQKYDGYEYCLHLQKVYNWAIKYQHLIDENIIYDVLSACWLHDIIEDARMTYNDIKQKFGYNIAELVFALTNEKGKTREERANDKYYNEMKLVNGAVFIKICDKLANSQYSFENKSSMNDTYKEEYQHFKNIVYNDLYKDMFIELEKYCL